MYPAVGARRCACPYLEMPGISANHGRIAPVFHRLAPQMGL